RRRPYPRRPRKQPKRLPRQAAASEPGAFEIPFCKRPRPRRFHANSPALRCQRLRWGMRRSIFVHMAELVIRRGLEEPDTSATFTPHKPQRPEKSMGGRKFELVSDYQPAGDQPTAIRELVEAAREGERTQVLLGVTGSGKTFT